MAGKSGDAVYVRLHGLKPDAVYLEEQSGRQYFGAALMHTGVPLPPFTREYEAYQFSFTELKEAGTLYEKVQKWRDGNVKNRVVISLYGGSGSGKTTLATALQQYFLNDGTGCYLLSGDDYQHRIPKRNDEERMRVYKEAGKTVAWISRNKEREGDFDRINGVLLRHFMRKRYDHIAAYGTGRWRDFIGRNRFFRNIRITSGVDTRAVTICMVWICPSFWKVPGRETRAAHPQKPAMGMPQSPFICRVVELEQEKLEVQRKNAGLIVGKDGRVYEP